MKILRTLLNNTEFAISVQGNMRFTDAPEFHRNLTHLVRNYDQSRYIVDLSNADFIHSIYCSILSSIAHKLAASDRSLCLIAGVEGHFSELKVAVNSLTTSGIKIYRSGIAALRDSEPARRISEEQCVDAEAELRLPAKVAEASLSIQRSQQEFRESWIEH